MPETVMISVVLHCDSQAKRDVSTSWRAPGWLILSLANRGPPKLLKNENKTNETGFGFSRVTLWMLGNVTQSAGDESLRLAAIHFCYFITPKTRKFKIIIVGFCPSRVRFGAGRCFILLCMFRFFRVPIVLPACTKTMRKWKYWPWLATIFFFNT